MRLDSRLICVSLRSVRLGRDVAANRSHLAEDSDSGSTPSAVTMADVPRVGADGKRVYEASKTAVFIAGSFGDGDQTGEGGAEYKVPTAVSMAGVVDEHQDKPILVLNALLPSSVSGPVASLEQRLAAAEASIFTQGLQVASVTIALNDLTEKHVQLSSTLQGLGTAPQPNFACLLDSQFKAFVSAIGKIENSVDERIGKIEKNFATLRSSSLECPSASGGLCFGFANSVSDKCESSGDEHPSHSSNKSAEAATPQAAYFGMATACVCGGAWCTEVTEGFDWGNLLERLCGPLGDTKPEPKPVTYAPTLWDFDDQD